MTCEIVRQRIGDLDATAETPSGQTSDSNREDALVGTIHAGAVSRFPDSTIIRVSDCPPISISRIDDELVAFSDLCPHLGARLSAFGAIRRTRVVCSQHGRAYQLQPRWPARAELPLARYPVAVIDDQVYVRVAPPAAPIVRETTMDCGSPSSPR